MKCLFKEKNKPPTKTTKNKILIRSVNQFGDEILRESNAKGAYYTVIEVKEHQLLLNLYYACYEDSINLSNKQSIELKACNRFFSGEL